MPPPAPAYLVRYGAMRLVGVCPGLPDLDIPRHADIVVRTDRGLEHATALCPATPRAVAAVAEPTKVQFVRPFTPADHRRVAEVATLQAAEFTRAGELAAGHKLAMQVVDVEHLFGGERVVVYFLADGRVDFRELVKSLAREFNTRIELRQIGVRDEAKLLADYGDCGRPVCCNTHMAVMPPVSMRMAKLQKSTLDPTKITGRCGRLKCCLRFEQDVYEEHQQELPPVGSRVVTTTGPGRVLAQEVLARRVLVEFEDGRRLPVPVADILTRL